MINNISLACFFCKDGGLIHLLNQPGNLEKQGISDHCDVGGVLLNSVAKWFHLTELDNSKEYNRLFTSLLCECDAGQKNFQDKRLILHAYFMYPNYQLSPL